MTDDRLPSWAAHLCPLDRECRTIGVARRPYLHTPWGSLIIGRRAQLWLPWKTTVPWGDGRSHYSRWFSPIVWHPR